MSVLDDRAKSAFADLLKSQEEICIKEIEKIRGGQLTSYEVKMVRFAFAMGMDTHRRANEIIGKVFKK